MSNSLCLLAEAVGRLLSRTDRKKERKENKSKRIQGIQKHIETPGVTGDLHASLRKMFWKMECEPTEEPSFFYFLKLKEQSHGPSGNYRKEISNPSCKKSLDLL